MADLTELRAVSAARARLNAEELALIDRARRAGATWAEIAAALGLSSRQAAEQRRLRLARAATRPVLPEAYGERIADLRQAAADLHRRIGADRRWDRRFRRAVLVRDTLAAAVEAPGGALFALVRAVADDLAEVCGPPPAPGGPAVAGTATALPGPSRAAVDRLRTALDAAARHA